MKLALFSKGSLGRFLAAGVPAFVLAVPLNYMLVEGFHWPKQVAYAVVMVFQVSVNFLMCRYLVFTRTPSSNLLKQYGLFSAGILFFRVGDWCTYYVLVELVGIYYLAVQVLNAALFSFFKFSYTRRIMK